MRLDGARFQGEPLSNSPLETRLCPIKHTRRLSADVTSRVLIYLFARGVVDE